MSFLTQFTCSIQDMSRILLSYSVSSYMTQSYLKWRKVLVSLKSHNKMYKCTLMYEHNVVFCIWVCFPLLSVSQILSQRIFFNTFPTGVGLLQRATAHSEKVLRERHHKSTLFHVQRHVTFESISKSVLKLFSCKIRLDARFAREYILQTDEQMRILDAESTRLPLTVW